ncbi:MAG: hypothetical protein V1911_01850 [Candidatus Micrarchaeota archaeon]
MERLGNKFETFATLAFSGATFPFWAFAIFAVQTTYTAIHPLIQYAVAVFFTGLLPTSIIYYSYKKGRIDINYSDRIKRKKFYALVELFYSAAALILIYLNAHDLAYLAVCYAVVNIAMFAINWKWKISAHTAGSAGPATAAVLVFGPVWAVLYFIPLFFIYLRHKQKAHTYAQLAAGIAVAVVVTYLTFLVFY